MIVISFRVLDQVCLLSLIFYVFYSFKRKNDSRIFFLTLLHFSVVVNWFFSAIYDTFLRLFFKFSDFTHASFCLFLYESPLSFFRLCMFVCPSEWVHPLSRLCVWASVNLSMIYFKSWLPICVPFNRDLRFSFPTVSVCLSMSAHFRVCLCLCFCFAFIYDNAQWLDSYLPVIS